MGHQRAATHIAILGINHYHTILIIILIINFVSITNQNYINASISASLLMSVKHIFIL